MIKLQASGGARNGGRRVSDERPARGVRVACESQVCEAGEGEGAAAVFCHARSAPTAASPRLAAQERRPHLWPGEWRAEPSRVLSISEDTPGPT